MSGTPPNPLATRNLRVLKGRSELAKDMRDQLRATIALEGWTHAEIGANMGVEKGNVSRILGNHFEPTVRSLERLASAIGYEFQVDLCRKKRL